MGGPRSAVGAYFTPKLFGFLAELKGNNTRAWFEANKARYEADVREPMLRFIADLGPRLRAVSRYVTADPRPSGGSMFRIHRDVRFSRDKSPYKTNVGAHFTHVQGGRDAHAPGYYLHLEAVRSFGGGGLWHPDPEALKKVRDRIVARAGEWKKIHDRLPIRGEALKRVPPGYDAAHPFADDLKFKDYYTYETFTEREVCARDFMDRFIDSCRTTAPLMEFLAKSLGLAW